MAATTFGLLAIVFVTFSLSQAEHTGYCPSFCDTRGVFHPGIHCHYAPNVYCCGSVYRMSCCANQSLDISGWYPEKYNCQQNTWFQIHWQVMMTMTGTLLLVMLFSACCCQCCRICAEKAREREHRITFQSGGTDTGTTIVSDADGNQFVADTGQAEGGQVTIQMFDPSSPFAFQPPEYTTLAKDPPKYNEVFGADGGNINPCYVPDSPPPPFSEAAGENGDPIPVHHPLNGAVHIPELDENQSTPITASNIGSEPQNDNQDRITTSEAQPLNEESEFVEVDLSRDNDDVITPEAIDESEALRNNEETRSGTDMTPINAVSCLKEDTEASE